MPRKKRENIEEISDKLEYLGLNLDKIPEKFKKFESLEYRVSRFYDEKKYRQYRYVATKDIQILLSPTNRLDDLQERYKKARPLCEYLDSKSEENVLKYTTFLNMLRNINIEDINKIEKEQNSLNKNIPFKVKFEGNYLWQIYYSENTDKYFMIVPTEDTDYSTFFFLLKKQLENKKNSKIFVPISNVQYSNQYFKKSEYQDIENYLWLFTKDWPLIYDVYDKKDELTLQIIGETEIYEKIKTPYKIELKNKTEANELYKLLKALFILQTELPNYFNFSTNIDEKGSLQIYLDDKKVDYEHISEFIREQYKLGLKRRKEIKTNIRIYTKKLKELKELAAMQDIEYLAKEKQISTFLECKKSFFGKFKYYFKYSKKDKKDKNNEKNVVEAVELKENNEKNKDEIKKTKKKIPIKKIYTLEELINSYKELEELENRMKNLVMDVNALKLKNKNMQKKIENAAKYIQEIDKHKKSIFEFWKYSNKDEISVLPEGEKEEVNVIRKIEKTFDYEEDLEEFGNKLDKIQRNNLDREDTDSIYIATTDLIKILNKLKTNNFLLEEIEKNLMLIKKEAKNEKFLKDEEYDIFGSLIEDSTKIKKIKDKKHRELPKDKFNILDININTKTLGYKFKLEFIIQNIIKALDKVMIPESLSVYKAMNDEKLNSKEINICNLNPENEMIEALKENGKEINLYKINIKEGTKGIGFTNIIFYDNQNKTLPIGMNLSTKMIFNFSKENLNLTNTKSFRIAQYEKTDDDLSNIIIKDVNVFEYEIIDSAEQEEEKQ